MICETSPASELVNARSVLHSDIDIIDPDLRLVSDPYVTYGFHTMGLVSQVAALHMPSYLGPFSLISTPL
jgi:hypothetical protein